MSEIVTAARWEQDRRSLDEHYPGARWVRVPGAPAGGEWQVPVSISPPARELVPVLEDLIEEKPVGFDKGGSVRHAQRCQVTHTSASLHIVKHFSSITGKYVVRVRYRGPVADPMVKVDDTGWTRQALSNHIHLNGDGTICALYPPDDTWNPARDALAAFIDHVVLWLFKSECWIANGAHPDGLGWPGPGQSHAIGELLGSSWHARCQCGSGKKFGKCCRPKFRAILLAEPTPELAVEFDRRIGGTRPNQQIDPRRQSHAVDIEARS